MLKLVLIGTIIASAVALRHPVNEDHVAEIKARATSWTPMEVSENPLSKYTVDEVYGMLGTLYPLQAPSNAHLVYNPSTPVTLPTDFQSATQWPGCVHAVRDQASCGSCWAFGASEELSDRFCVATGGKTNIVLSPQDLVSCDKVDMGCNGGWLMAAHNQMENHGIVSDACMPYTSGKGISGACPADCTGTGQYKKYYCAKGSPKQIAKGQYDAIKTELSTNGPMEVAFTVYNDFFSYSTGVYVSHPASGVAGGHAIKLVGWGHDAASGLDYWTCANSWGTGWGEAGNFRIKIGDVSGIDDQATYCTPDLARMENPTF